MGRELKRVALDFAWPMDKRWKGYTTDRAPCPDDHATIGEGDYCHTCFADAGEAGTVGVDPPAGDGWQLWETVSEGSPISPVFPTPEGLIDFMSQPPLDPYPWARGYSRKAAEAFVRGSGWAPSAVFAPSIGFADGVTGMAALDETKDTTNGK